MPDSFSSQLSENVLTREDNTLLLESVTQGDTAALQKFLDLNLMNHKVRVVEIEIRQARLQISLSGAVVPEQNVFEPLLQSWIAPLELANISTVELYGQRDGSDLPFWRSSFSPSDFELNPLGSIIKPEVTLPTEFIDPLQIEFKAPSESTLMEDSLPERLPEKLPERLTETQSTHAPAVASVMGVAIAIAPDSDDVWAVDEKEPESPVTQEQPMSAVVSDEKTKAVKDFLARYAAGEREFAKINLSETDLSGVNLTLANLHASELIWTNLEGANLYHINLSGAKLRHANLSGAMLRSSNLQGTDFLNANLRGTDLSWSNLNGANLTGADLTDANLKNAILERVILPDGTLLD
jgi:uncharacterized protein (DUF2384 family)